MDAGHLPSETLESAALVFVWIGQDAGQALAPTVKNN